jgi:hypothetical protein
VRSTGDWVYQPLNVVRRHNSPPALCEQVDPGTESLRQSFIVASPQYPYDPDSDNGRRSWKWDGVRDGIVRILALVVERFHGDRGRLCTTGFSRGGRGAISITQWLNTERPAGALRVAKLVVVDSEAFPADPDVPTWVHHGGPHTLDNVAKEHQRLAKSGAWTPVAARSGAPVPHAPRLITDWNHTHTDSTNMPDRLRNHTATCTSAYADPRIYEWLLR